MDKLDNALELLISLIENNGAEFPDASNRAAFRFKLTPSEVSKLTEMYDAYCEGK